MRNKLNRRNARNNPVAKRLPSLVTATDDPAAQRKAPTSEASDPVASAKAPAAGSSPLTSSPQTEVAFGEGSNNALAILAGGEAVQAGSPAQDSGPEGLEEVGGDRAGDAGPSPTD